MRRMRAEQIRYRFGRNFLPFRGMCCFNLIRYGTYQQMKALGESVRLDTPALLPPHQNFHHNPPYGHYWLSVRKTGTMIYSKTDIGTCCGTGSKGSRTE